MDDFISYHQCPKCIELPTSYNFYDFAKEIYLKNAILLNIKFLKNPFSSCVFIDFLLMNKHIFVVELTYQTAKKGVVGWLI